MTTPDQALALLYEAVAALKLEVKHADKAQINVNIPNKELGFVVEFSDFLMELSQFEESKQAQAARSAE